MKRAITILSAFVVLGAASLAYAGGMAPGTPGPKVKLSGPTINGVMVVDTHPDGTTFVTSAGGGYTEHKAKLASIWLQRGGLTASAIVRLPTAFTAGLGCDVTKTDARFGFDATKFDNNSLLNYMPSDTVNALLTALGLTPGVVGHPVITATGNNVCTPDPENTSSTNGIPGIISFEFNIQFFQP